MDAPPTPAVAPFWTLDAPSRQRTTRLPPVSAPVHVEVTVMDPGAADRYRTHTSALPPMDEDVFCRLRSVQPPDRESVIVAVIGVPVGPFIAVMATRSVPACGLKAAVVAGEAPAL